MAEVVSRLLGQTLASAQIDGHLTGNALRNTLLGALSVALMRRSGSLSLINLSALLKAAAHAMNGTLARLGLRRERAITAAVSLLAEAGTVVAVSVLRAVVETGLDVAGIAGPSGVAVANSVNALSVAAALSSVSGADRVAVLTTPSVLARALSVEALSVSGAAISLLVLLTLAVAVLLTAVVSGVSLVADALHLSSNREADSVSGARRRAGRQSAVKTSETGLAEASSVVAVSLALAAASLNGAVEASPSRGTLAGEVDAVSVSTAVVGAGPD